MKPLSVQVATIVVLVLSLARMTEAQNLHRAKAAQLLTSALIIRSAPGFLETIGSRDPIEARMVFGTWVPPVVGDSIRYNDTLVARWEPMKADSNGWFHHEALSGGYVFVGLEADEDETILLAGMGHAMVYMNGSPRSGNPYGYKDTWESWEPHFDYSILPVHLRKGLNTLLFQCNREILKVRLLQARAQVLFNAADVTLPDLVVGNREDSYGAIVVMNASDVLLKDLNINVAVGTDSPERTAVPQILPMSVRKIPFRIRAKAFTTPGQQRLFLGLVEEKNGSRKILDSVGMFLRVVNPLDNRKETFISRIDGSVQYFSVSPAHPLPGDPKPALFFSLHGAGVEALNQTASYAPKRWGSIVAPTNRRPFGYNWEDWGRSDALEVLDIVGHEWGFNEARVYLTGHSMGGHGVYHVASLFPDRFAAIGPSAGWLSFWSYRVREPFDHPSPMREMIQRATLPSHTFTMSRNFRQLGVYILHGSLDDNVPVQESRIMADSLETFHRDFIYHEQPGVGHWWDLSDEPGTDCVDWAPMFDFFARHARSEKVQTRGIDFAVANPGISSQDSWVGIETQEHQLKLSTINIHLDPVLRRFTGVTSNVGRLSIDASVLTPGAPFSVVLDSQNVTGIEWPKDGGKVWLERLSGRWKAVGKPSPALKGPHRYGTLKDAIGNRVLFVYGTRGSAEENRWAFDKARFDAERFWYQGNGSIDIVADVDFNLEAERDRNVMLFGNSSSNAAWNALLSESPVQVQRGLVKVGDHIVRGDDLSCLFIRPRPGSDIASVGVIAGSGLRGMKLCTKMAYLMPGIGFPDCLLLRADVLVKGEQSILAAGFFGIDWGVETGEFVWQNQ